PLEEARRHSIPNRRNFLLRAFLLNLMLVCVAAGRASSATIVDVYSAPANGTDLAPSTPATNVSGTLITGWVYGDQIPIPGHTGEAIWADLVRVDNTSAAPITFGLYLGMWTVDASGHPGTVQQVAGTVPITLNPGNR